MNDRARSQTNRHTATAAMYGRRRRVARLITVLVLGMALVGASAQASNSSFSRLTAKPEAFTKPASGTGTLATPHRWPAWHLSAATLIKLRWCKRWFSGHHSHWWAPLVWRQCVSRSLARPSDSPLPPADTTPPKISIGSSPPASTEERSATFSFSSSEAGSSFQCKLDSAAWTGCSSPQSYSGLSVADHTFSVRATDAAGNVDDTPAIDTWTVEATPPPPPPPPPDTTPPETSIDASPSSPTQATAASFSFSSSEAGSSFQCKLDSAAWTGCSSPQSYSGLSVADHTFSVRATDAAGNVDDTPAIDTWTVEATPPPPPPPPSSCSAGAVNATTSGAAKSAVSSGKSVCVTADVGDVNFSDMGNRSGVVISTNGGSMGHLDIDSTTGLTISSARFRSVELRSASGTTIQNSTIGGTAQNRTYDQLIFAPDTSPNVTIRNNEIAWTLADDSGGTGYGCRCYGTLDNFRFTGNWVHDIAADGLQGFNGTNITIDRNNIGPVGANPGSSEHSDTIQVVGNDAGMKITNNYLHDQGYWRNDDGSLRAVGNAATSTSTAAPTEASSSKTTCSHTARAAPRFAGSAPGGRAAAISRSITTPGPTWDWGTTTSPASNGTATPAAATRSRTTSRSIPTAVLLRMGVRAPSLGRTTSSASPAW